MLGRVTRWPEAPGAARWSTATLAAEVGQNRTAVGLEQPLVRPTGIGPSGGEDVGETRAETAGEEKARLRRDLRRSNRWPFRLPTVDHGRTRLRAADPPSCPSGILFEVPEVAVLKRRVRPGIR